MKIYQKRYPNHDALDPMFMCVFLYSGPYINTCFL